MKNKHEIVLVSDLTKWRKLIAMDAISCIQVSQEKTIETIKRTKEDGNEASSRATANPDRLP